MDAISKTTWVAFAMNTNEGVKHVDENEHIHENAHQITNHFLEGLEFYCQLLIRHLFVSSNTKLSSKDKTNPREKENLHKVTKLRIFFQMDVEDGGNSTHKTHILKVLFLSYTA